MVLSLAGRAAVLGLAAATLAGMIAARPGDGDANVSPVFGVSLPSGYRAWQVVSVAHEAGQLNDIRVILGNDIAMRAYRRGARPFPDGTRLVRIAWKMVPSPRNNAIFGQEQSFVAGDPTTVQVVAKDGRRYSATGGWGYAQFEGGKVNRNEALIRTCFACHAKLPASDDFIFTSYSR